MRRKTSSRTKRAARRAQERRRRRLAVGLSIIGALAVGGLLIWAGQPKPPEEVALPESLQAPPGADGKAWGPPDAPVLVEEFSDFQ
ncbi:MAG: hypothetical protein ACE5FI_16115 [Anaerolineales bacterium]